MKRINLRRLEALEQARPEKSGWYPPLVIKRYGPGSATERLMIDEKFITPHEAEKLISEQIEKASRAGSTAPAIIEIRLPEWKQVEERRRMKPIDKQLLYEQDTDDES
jgi:hypothetical protein